MLNLSINRPQSDMVSFYIGAAKRGVNGIRMVCIASSLSDDKEASVPKYQILIVHKNAFGFKIEPNTSSVLNFSVTSRFLDEKEEIVCCPFLR